MFFLEVTNAEIKALALQTAIHQALMAQSTSSTAIHEADDNLNNLNK